MSYALYKFNKAIVSLPETKVRKREWLASNYMYHLIHLQDTDIPLEIKREFLEFKRDLTKVHAQGVDSSLQATVSKMNDAEAGKMIERVVRMYNVIKNNEALP